MRIGVDARSLAEPITGIGRYTLELLSLMVEQDHEWVLYSHRPLMNGNWEKSNVTVRTLNLPTRLLRMLWAQTVLPYWANSDSVDLFWSPAHRLPSFLPHSISRVVTIHDLVWQHAPETMRKLSQFLDSKLMPLAVEVSDRVIAVSESTAQDLTSMAPAANKKIVVIHEAYTPLLSKKNKHSAEFLTLYVPYIFFVGTLEPRKNLKRLLEAYSRLPDSLKNEYLLVIAGGKGWGDENVEEVIKCLGLEDNVNILGYVADDQLASLYQHAQLFVMPSLYEGFGLPLLEAMSFATPVLTSNISSMPEIVGDAAFLVDPHSVDSIKDGLEIMLLDASLRTRLGQQGRERAQTFSWQKAAEKTLELFEQVVAQRRICLDAQS